MSNYSTVELPPAAGDSPPPQPHPRHRRALWLSLIAGLAVLVLVVPLALFLAFRGGGGDKTTATTNPGATASAPAATPGVPSAPGAAPAAPQGRPAPDGRITYDQMKNATLDIPAWPADGLTGLSGKVKFTNGEATTPPDARFTFERHIVIERVPVYGDVDRDGALETVVVIGCYVQGGSEQLLAFDRDTAGRIVTLGTVVSTTGPIRIIEGNFGTPPTVNSAGVISVRVADYQNCCGDETPTNRQTRQYAWNGHGFAQVGGPTAFPANPHITETGATTGELVFGPAVGGVRRGTLTVTVTYLYGTAPDHLQLEFKTPDGIVPDGGWTATPTEHYSVTVDVRTPTVGVPAGYALGFQAPATLTPGQMAVYLRGMTKANEPLGEINPYNGPPAVTYRVVN